MTADPAPSTGPVWEDVDPARLWDLAPVLLAVADMANGTFVAANRAWHTLLGLDPAALRGTSFLERLHPDDVEKTEAIAAQMLGDDRPVVGFTNRYRSSTGEYRTFQWSGRAPENLAYAVGVDVTDRDRVDTFLRLYGATAVAANTAHDLDDAMRTIVVAVCEITGWPVGHAYLHDDATGELVPTDIWYTSGGRFQAFRDVTSATTFGPGVGLPGRVLASGEAQWIPDVLTSNEFIRGRGAGDLGIRGGLAFPVRAGADIVAVLEFFTVEPLLEVDEILAVGGHVGELLGQVVERDRATTAAREQTAVEERYLAMASHDLRSPLASIRSAAELLTTRWESMDDDGKLEFVRSIEEGSTHLVEVLETFLDSSRARLEGPAATMAPVPLAQALADAARHADAGDVTVDCTPGLAAAADPSFLSRILVNLLSNAAKYGAPPIDITARGFGTHRVQIRVRDHGRGVEAGYVPSLFQRFSQADPDADGVGLGLSICRELALAQRGNLQYEPAEPGACFVLTLLRSSD